MDLRVTEMYSPQFWTAVPLNIHIIFTIRLVNCVHLEYRRCSFASNECMSLFPSEKPFMFCVWLLQSADCEENMAPLSRVIKKKLHKQWRRAFCQLWLLEASDSLIKLSTCKWTSEALMMWYSMFILTKCTAIDAIGNWYWGAPLWKHDLGLISPQNLNK